VVHSDRPKHAYLSPIDHQQANMENTGRTAMTVARRWYHPASGTPKLDTNEQLVKTITQLAQYPGPFLPLEKIGEEMG
jgi:hypothetical protein